LLELDLLAAKTRKKKLSISQPVAKSPRNITWPLCQKDLAVSGQIDLSGRETNASMAIADAFHRYLFLLN
jgi:hypothetical protein